MRRLAGVVAVMGLALGAGAAEAAPGRDRLPGAAQFLGCKKLPPGSPTVKLTFEEGASVTEVIAFMSTLSCTPLVLDDEVAPETKVNIGSSKLVTSAKAYSMLHDALKAAGLAIVPASDRLQIVRLADEGRVARRPVWVKRSF